jgi:hypothetical protein
MPIDTSMYQQKPVIPNVDPMGQAKQFMEMKQAQQQQQLAQLQLDNYKKSLRLEDLARQIFAQYPDDLKAARREMLTQAGPAGLEYIDAVAKNNKLLDDADTAQLQKLMSTFTVIENMVNKIAQVPEQQRGQAVFELKSTFKQMNIPDDLIGQFPDNLDNDSLFGTQVAIASQKNDAQKRLDELNMLKTEVETESALRTMPDESGLTPYQRAQLNQPTGGLAGEQDRDILSAYAKRIGKRSYLELNSEERVKARNENSINKMRGELEAKAVIEQQASQEEYTETDLDPASRSILAQTGLSFQGFMALTGQLSKLSRDKATRNKALNEATNWANRNDVDISLLGPQYDAISGIVKTNITRKNMTQILEREMQGTLDNLFSVIDERQLTNVRVANILAIWAGQEVNDPLASRYAFHLEQLISEYAGYNAAAQGRYGAQIDQADYLRAEEVLKKGLTSGGLGGVRIAVTDSTNKIDDVLTKTIESGQRAIWGLFGLEDRYDKAHQKEAVEDPAIKAYADKYFGGDIEAAKKAIQQQRGQ